jgi:hypothetical protein
MAGRAAGGRRTCALGTRERRVSDRYGPYPVVKAAYASVLEEGLFLQARKPRPRHRPSAPRGRSSSVHQGGRVRDSAELTFTRRRAAVPPRRLAALRRNAPNPSLTVAVCRIDRRGDRQHRPCSRPRARAPFRPLRAGMLCSAAQSENVERKPCAVRSSRFIRRNSINIVMLDIGSARRGPGNTGAAGSGFPSRRNARGCTCSSTANAAPEIGTRCSRPDFMRSAGTTQTLFSRSTSP